MASLKSFCVGGYAFRNQGRFLNVCSSYIKKRVFYFSILLSVFFNEKYFECLETTCSPLVEGRIFSPDSVPVTSSVDLCLSQVLLSDFFVVLLYLLNHLLWRQSCYLNQENILTM